MVGGLATKSYLNQIGIYKMAIVVVKMVNERNVRWVFLHFVSLPVNNRIIFIQLNCVP